MSFEDWDRIYRIVQKHALIRNEINLEANKLKRLEIVKKVLSSRGKSEILWYPEEYRQIAMDALHI